MFRFAPALRCGLLALIISLASGLSGSGLSSVLADEQATPAASPVASGSGVEGLPALLETCDSVFGVVILDPDGNTVFEQNPDLPFVSASLYKLVLVTEILRRVESGELQLNDTVEILPEYFDDANGEDSYFVFDAIGYMAPIEELLYSAGSYSSNVGAQALISLTSTERLEEFAFELGLVDTHYWMLPGEAADLYGYAEATSAEGDFARSIAFVDSFAGSGYVNVTTPRDMSIFFHMLSNDSLVSPVVSWQVKQVLTSRVINDRLPALLPSTALVIHKTGNLYGVLHDAGIVETPEGPVVVIAMAQAVTDYDTTFTVEQRLGLFGYEYGGGQPGGDLPATPAALGSSRYHRIIAS